MKEKLLELLKEEIKKEPFANHMGISLRDLAPGYALAEAKFSKNMDSFHKLIHGGAIFSLIDVAFGAASNSHGRVALALNINLTYIEPPEHDFLLIAEAREESRTRHTATYHMEVRQKNNSGDRKIATCQAIVYIKDKRLEFSEETKAATN